MTAHRKDNTLIPPRFGGKGIAPQLRTEGFTPCRAVVLCILIGVMAALLNADWPGALPDARSEGSHPWLSTMAWDVLYSYPVPVCLLAAWFLGRIPPTGGVAKRWRLCILAAVIVASLVSLWGVNRFYLYRLGVPGFLVPFTLSVILFPPIWNLNAAPDSKIPMQPVLMVSALAWAAVSYVLAVTGLLPMWLMCLMILPLPVMVWLMYRHGISTSGTQKALAFFTRYLWLICASTALPLVLRAVRYFEKFYE